jgi:diguanylate cyclase (GGDEF)-like protein
MPTQPLVTKKFPKVAPIVAPGLREGGGPRRRASSELASTPAWTDEPPTVRMLAVPVALAAVVARADRATLTVLVGLNAGQAFALSAGQTIVGRSHDAQIPVEDPGISRRHLCVWRQGERFMLDDLGSANGVFVNGARIQHTELVDGDRIQVGPSVVLRFGVITADEEALARRLYDGATRDTLTGLFNREYARERLTAEIAYAQRHGTRLGVIMADIDHFKRVNDGFGHAAGDIVLRLVAAQIQRTSRSEDVVARYGGEEFVVIVRGVEHTSVSVLSERIRRAVQRLVVPWESASLSVTMSLGSASLVECGSNASADALVATADERLYRAKAQGRNRVC